jgi:hypothetical protein
MKVANRLILAAVGLAAIVGCKESIIDPPKDTAQIRLVHATPGLSALDMDVAGSAVIRGIAFGNTSAVVVVPSGSQQLVVRAGNQVVGNLSGSLSTSHINNVVVADGIASLSSVVDNDTGSVAPARANVRLVVTAAENTSDPTLLQALLTWSGAADSTMRFGIDTKVARYFSLMYFNPGHFTVKYVPTGTDGPVLAEAGFDVAAGEKKALVLSRGADGVYKVEVVVEK